MDTPERGLAAVRVVELLTEYGRRTAMMGGNPYRARAYIRAAESLSAQTEQLSELVAHDRLQDIPGRDATIAALIKQLYLTGYDPKLEQMREEIPAGVLDLFTGNVRAASNSAF